MSRSSVLLLTIVTAILWSPAPVISSPSFGLLDGRDRGVESGEGARGIVTPTVDETTGKDVLELSYSAPEGAPVAVWIRGFPEGLNPGTGHLAKIGIRLFDATQAAQISVKAEWIGTGRSQTVLLLPKNGWNFVEEPIDWQKIGSLNEIRFIVTPAEGAGVVAGTLSFTLDFISKSLVAEPAPAVKAPAPEPVIPKERPVPASLNLLEAAEREVLEEGSGTGTMVPTFDEVVEKDIIELDYKLPEPESSVTLSAKNFPEELQPEFFNTAKIGVRVLKAEQAKNISATLEFQGTQAVQTLPLPLRLGWNSLREPVDWERIGDLQEVRLQVRSGADAPGLQSGSKTGGFAASGPVRGTLPISLEFIKADSFERTKAPADTFTVFNLLDAGEKGVFNIGPSGGAITGAFDEAAQKDVWKFDYTLPQGSTVGVWTKSYPPEFGPLMADAVRIGVTVPTTDELHQAAVKIEIKGERDTQSIPLTLKLGRNTFREPVHWNTLGGLKEVVIVVSPMAANPSAVEPVWFNPTEMAGSETGGFAATGPGANAPGLLDGNKTGRFVASGTFFFDLDFGKVTFLEKYQIFIKTGLVFFLSLLLALFVKFGVPAPKQLLRRTFESSDGKKVSILHDFFYGGVTVLAVASAVKIYAFGRANPLEDGFAWGFLVVALLGGVIAELLQWKLAGRHLTPAQVFQNVFIAGFLAASSSKEELLQAPATWGQLLAVTSLTASVTFLIYQAFNAYSLASSGKHLRRTTSALIVGTPYLFGWLLVVENTALLEPAVQFLTGGLLNRWPVALETLVRLLVVFVFNEAVTNGIGVVAKGRVLKTFQAHGLILAASAGVVLSPLIADLGSAEALARWPLPLQSITALLAAMLSYAAWWGEVYLVTGTLLDGGHRREPSQETLSKHVGAGMKKGMAYAGILLGLLYGLRFFLNASLLQMLMKTFPLLAGTAAGALVFPLFKTIIESFDGSIPFFQRLRYSYRQVPLYFRGAVAGFGFAVMVTHGLFDVGTRERITFGLWVGLAASGGVSFVRDVFWALRKQGKVQSWKLYLTDSLLGIFVGAAMAFYLDTLQVPVIVEKFRLYTGFGFAPVDYVTYPLVNKWGKMDLGSYTGGVKLLYLESLAGVINWSIAAWLFAVNKVFLQAYFEKDTTPIKFFFSKAGLAQLVEHMIFVMRWGLWMAPIIFTFLRMMPDPTWYNQDGAVRSLVAIYRHATMSPEAFQVWSLKIFVSMMAFDFLRILIWMDHMGLRVATLVNLSFIGLDRLDEKTARWIGPAAAQRYIPEGVKRFATWAPLLIPFYLPRGAAWDFAWSTSEAMQNAARGRGLIPTIEAMNFSETLLLIGAAFLISSAVWFLARRLTRRSRARRLQTFELSNREYRTVLREDGESASEVTAQELDLSRRSYDTIDPSGRVLFLVETGDGRNGKNRVWPVVGNFPTEKFEPSRIEKAGDTLRVINTSQGVRMTLEITLPDRDTPAELWSVTLDNLTGEPRDLKVVPYLEWLLNGWIHDRFHTQYARLFPEMEYVSGANAVLAWHKGTKSMGILASDIPPEGFLTSRMDFIGRARTIWSPRALETWEFSEARDRAPYPTFDPIGSLALGVNLGPEETKKVCLLIGYAKNRKGALELIGKTLAPKTEASPGAHAPGLLDGNKTGCFVASGPSSKEKKTILIGHGKIPAGTPLPYSEFSQDGRTLKVNTPFTPRPIDHALSNEIHSVMVTNRGLHTSCNGNSQQNRVTPDWADTVTREIPSEAIYLYDPDTREWFSPTYHPLNDLGARHESEFSVDGTALFRMTKGTLSTELTVFVPPKDPAGVYLLTIKNQGDRPRKMRVAPYFQMALAFMPERSGPLETRQDKALGALFFQNSRNMFRTGWAFAAMTIPSDRTETRRGRFFGKGRSVAHPSLVEKGEPDKTQTNDPGQIAGFLGTVEIPAGGETTMAVVLGQTEDWKGAVRLVQKYKKIGNVQASLEETRRWWNRFMETVQVETTHPEFDRFQYWLKYQALAERIWARRGFYQTSGAFGFRDQLQDTVNLIWVDPALARKQIILHASHQFLEGDVYHWFFTLTDGRTAFSCRSHASDNPVWLSWGLAEYLRATGDESILDEMTSYVTSEFPYNPLPKNKGGWGHLYPRSTRSDTVYRHSMKSIDLVFEKRTGKHGLPLMGTGDWNDGLDEIGSEGKGESVWLGFFLYTVLRELLPVIEKKEGSARRESYQKKLNSLGAALELTWRGDRYLRAFHDDGTEIGVKGTGIWEIDALTAAWAVMAGINPARSLTVFNTALEILEKEDTILLGWPALREDTKPYLGRSSKYPEGVRENGMYCHGVQWLVRAARILAERFEKEGNRPKAAEYRQIAYRLWRKIGPLAHTTPDKIEIYGGQPNKQAADILTNFDPGRMIWHGYTGAAGWMLRQAMEGVVGAALVRNEMILPKDLDQPRGTLKILRVSRAAGKNRISILPPAEITSS